MALYAFNITLFGTTQKEIASLLTERKVRAYISPTIRKVTVVSQKGGDDEQQLQALAQELSQATGCPALALQNWDDDVLSYRLFEAGEGRDEYISSPSYVNPCGLEIRDPEGGSASALCQAFGISEEKIALVECLLRTPRYQPAAVGRWFSDDFGLSATEKKAFMRAFRRLCGWPYQLKQLSVEGLHNERIRHAALAAALRWSDYAIALNYDDVEDDCWPAGEERMQVVGE